MADAGESKSPDNRAGGGFAEHRVIQLESSRGSPGWRNWQTRRTQNPVGATPSEFDSRPGHQYAPRAIPTLPARHSRAALAVRHGGADGVKLGGPTDCHAERHG